MSFKPQHQDSFEIENCLSLMTDKDLDKFFNLYKIIKNIDPNANALIKNASTEKILSGELIDEEHIHELSADKSEETEPPIKKVVDISSNDYTFFDVYDHIESWKKRISPMMNKIDNLVEEFKTISQRTSSTNILKVSNELEHKTKNSNVDFTLNSDRYLSNIDKYIEIGESHNLLSEVFHQSTAGHDGLKANGAVLHSKSDKFNVQDKIGNETKKVLPLIIDEEKTQQLVPTNEYLETENITNVDEFEVKTYFKW